MTGTMAYRESLRALVLLAVAAFAAGKSKENGGASVYWATLTANANLTEPDYYMFSIGDFPNASQPVSSGGRATSTHSCSSVRAVPSGVRSYYRLDYFYRQYTEAYGIPILGSSTVSAAALSRACYIVRFMFADIYSVRNSYLQKNGRFAIMASTEVTTHIPEHRSLGAWWNTRARGLGATVARPVSTGAEENVLCYDSDRYRVEDIGLHEFSHGLHLLGASFAISGFDSRLRAAYNSAKYRGLWANTYAMSTDHEYWAEGVQSYFNVNGYANPSDGIHNTISTREKLRAYDPTLYNMVAKMFPCNNRYIDRCTDKKSGFRTSASQKLKLNYPACTFETGGKEITVRPPVGRKTTVGPTVDKSCVDKNAQCGPWASRGECTKNPDYMKVSCKKSCNLCSSGCADLNQYCSVWAKYGSCSTSSQYMAKDCRKSCNLC